MSIPVFVTAFFSVLILPVVGIILFFRMRSRESIMQRYEGTPESQSVFVKKYNEASVPYYYTAFLLTGVAIALGILLMAFNYKAPLETGGELMVDTFIDEEIENIPQTNQTPPPPPPPPPPPEVLEVDNDEEIEEAPQIFEQDFQEEMVIDEPVYTPAPEKPKEPEPEEPDFFVVVEDMPQYPGGEAAMYKWLGKNIKYPQVAKENGIEGKVYVQFIIDEKGKVRDAKVVRGIGGGCDEEALRVVKEMPEWKPGKQRGKPVRVQFTIPIHFQLN
jgi:protein TonB